MLGRAGDGSGFRAAAAFQLLDHRFPGHPDFDPNGRGRELSGQPNSTPWLGAVDLAAQDKVGRYEVPRGDVATLKKIANPLKLGVMHEQAFVLLHEWPDLINQEGGRPAPGHRRPAPGLDRARSSRACPRWCRTSSIVCYSIQADKEWLRGGRPVPDAAKVETVTDDLALRSQELPTEAEFDAASGRAAGDLPGAAGAGAHRPVGAGDRRRCSGDNAGGLRSAAEDRCRTNSDSTRRRWAWPRTAPGMATSRIVTTLLARLAAADGATQTLRVLAGAELAKDNAIYARAPGGGGGADRRPARADTGRSSTTSPPRRR